MRGAAENPVRGAFMLTARMELVLTSPNTRSPLMVPPRPHAMQNAAPVPVQTQDLPSDVGREVLRVRRVVGVADHDVELAVGPEQDPTTVVIVRGAALRGHQDPHPRAGGPVLPDADQLVAQLPAPNP